LFNPDDIKDCGEGEGEGARAFNVFWPKMGEDERASEGDHIEHVEDEEEEITEPGDRLLEGGVDNETSWDHLDPCPQQLGAN